MVNIYRDYSSGYFDLVISDECHRSIYGKWSGVLKHFDGVQIGLTATPCVAERAEHRRRRGQAVRPRHAALLRGGQADLHLQAARTRSATAISSPTRSTRPRRSRPPPKAALRCDASELDWTAMDEATRAEFEELFGGERTRSWSIPPRWSGSFTIPERNRAIVREFREVLENGYTDAQGRPAQAAASARPSCSPSPSATPRRWRRCSTRHSPTGSRRPKFATPTTSSPAWAGRHRRRHDQDPRFKKEEFPQILVSVNMLDTGFDCPEVVNLVFARFTKSAILYQQMRGRGTRKSPGQADLHDVRLRRRDRLPRR